jgi:hypothetical protein
MQSRDNSDRALPWFSAEGQLNDMPLLIRGRDIPLDSNEVSQFPNRVVLDVHFEVSDASGLPSEEHYRLLEEFETRTLDSVEASGEGLAVLVRTHNGTIRYLLYGRDSDAIAETARSALPNNFSIEISSSLDPLWSQYRHARNQIAFLPNS